MASQGRSFGAPRSWGLAPFGLRAASTQPLPWVKNQPIGRGLGSAAGKAAKHRLIELRPQLQQGQGAIEAHIEAFAPGVVEALEHPESAHGTVAGGGTPEAFAAAVELSSTCWRYEGSLSSCWPGLLLVLSTN